MIKQLGVLLIPHLKTLCSPLLATLELSLMLPDLDMGRDSYKAILKTVLKIYETHLEDSYILWEFTPHFLNLVLKQIENLGQHNI